MYVSRSNKKKYLYFLLEKKTKKKHLIWSYVEVWIFIREFFNPCSAEPGYTVPLQTV